MPRNKPTTNGAISKTVAVAKILNSRGRMFTVRWKTKSGKSRELNGKLVPTTVPRKNQDKIFGLITMSVPMMKSFRRVDTRTINGLSIDGKRFKVK